MRTLRTRLRIDSVFCGQVNGNELTINSDGTPNSYLALFPNFDERTSFPGDSDPLGTNMRDTGSPVFLANPSRRTMPTGYFTFMEFCFGSSLFVQTDGGLPGVSGVAVGIR